MSRGVVEFLSIVDLIQLTLMKAIYSVKNMMNRNFERCMETKLIEVMNMKMQMIQFVSIANLIQMKLMRVMHNVTDMTNNELHPCMEYNVY
jgi:hypothetical protein